MNDFVYDPKEPNYVHFRPNPGARPIKYENNTALQGILLDRKHAIAMYTSRAGMAVGPPGPLPDVFDTIIASASDEATPLTLGGPKTTFRAPYPLDMTEGYVRISLTNAPTGAALIVSLLMNDAAFFTTPVQIDSGMKTSVGSVVTAVIDPTKLSVPDDAEFQVFIDQIGSTYAGSGLKVAVTGKKVVS